MNKAKFENGDNVKFIYSNKLYDGIICRYDSGLKAYVISAGFRLFLTKEDKIARE